MYITECPECGGNIYNPDWRFCPHCGFHKTNKEKQKKNSKILERISMIACDLDVGAYKIISDAVDSAMKYVETL